MAENINPVGCAHGKRLTINIYSSIINIFKAAFYFVLIVCSVNQSQVKAEESRAGQPADIRQAADTPVNVIAAGHDSRIDLRWDAVRVSGFEGYNVYRSSDAGGPYAKLNSGLYSTSVYSDFLGANDLTYFYYITSVVSGLESVPSETVTAASFEMTDEELLTSIQEVSFRYCWDFAHPDCGLTRERFDVWDRDTVTTGGSGFGLMNIILGVERGFITREDAADRVLLILNWMATEPIRYYGAWSHWNNGATGDPVEFDSMVSVDLVETAFFIEGVLAVRQYFDGADVKETEVRSAATGLWESVEWDWFLKDAGSEELYWYWSPDTGWDGSFPIAGYNECMIVYLLAIASPTHPIPASCYYNGYAKESSYWSGVSHYGLKQWAGQDVGGGPMFFSHYSFIGFDPRDKRDKYCNYFSQGHNTSLIQRYYCIDNPYGYSGYGADLWGLTASQSPPPVNYKAHRPYDDNGTIAPTAALSSMPYTPTESLACLKHMYHTYGAQLWGPFGFKDAFNLTENWWSDSYLAIDQGPIAPMIENYRTNLLWNMFMANPEIMPALTAIGWTFGLRDADNPSETEAGLDYQYYEGWFTELPDFDLLTPVAEGSALNFDLNAETHDDDFAYRFSGYIVVPWDGSYDFYLESDDGSRLYIGEQLVVDNGGLHTIDVKEEGGIDLRAGLHEITVLYFDHTGIEELIVKYEGAGIIRQQIPDSVLFRGTGTPPATVDVWNIY